MLFYNSWYERESFWKYRQYSFATNVKVATKKKSQINILKNCSEVYIANEETENRFCDYASMYI